MSSDPDPEKLLRGWVKGPPPEWQSEKAYSECQHCNDKFERGHRHNCRLCGELFCSRCTGKYHLPTEFDPKGKTGPMRVCYGCRNNVLDKKRELSGTGRGAAELLPATQFITENGFVRIHPPVWDEKTGGSECRKCHELLKGKGHNCRACGRNVCSDCSSKMSVPDAFKKKSKPGDARVCDACRYVIVDGAIWDPTPIAMKAAGGPLSPRGDSSDEEDEKPHFPRPLSSTGSLEHVDAVQNSVALNVRWEYGDHVLVTVAGNECSPETSLATLHGLLVKKRPQLGRKRFQYLCRGKPVFPEHFDIFQVKHVSPQLLLRTDERMTVDMGRSPPISNSTSPIPGPPSPMSYGVASTNQNTLAVPTASMQGGGYRGSVSVSQTSESSHKTLMAVAIYDFAALDDTQMSLTRTDLLTILDKEDAEWWFASNDKKGTRGWIPASYVEEVPWTAPSARPSMLVRPKAAGAAATASTTSASAIPVPTASASAFPAPATSATLSPRGGATAAAASSPRAAASADLFPPPALSFVPAPAGSTGPSSPGPAASTGQQSVDDILRARAKMFKK